MDDLSPVIHAEYLNLNGNSTYEWDPSVRYLERQVITISRNYVTSIIQNHETQTSAPTLLKNTLTYITIDLNVEDNEWSQMSPIDL